MRPLAATEMCRWCKREIEGVQMQVTAPSGAAFHWTCALMAADRGLLEQADRSPQYRLIDAEILPA